MNRALQSLVVFIIVSTVFLSCTNRRQALNEIQATSSQEKNLQFPHAKDFRLQHILLFKDPQNLPQDTQQKCSICHGHFENTVKLNVGCGGSCHQRREDNTPPINPRIPSEHSCLGCHQNKFTLPSHHPAGSGLCQSCHTVSEGHKEKDKLAETDSKNQNCYQCHTRLDQKSHVHTLISTQDSSCITCHNPHGSNLPHFLTSAPPALCTDCHEAQAPENAEDFIHKKHGKFLDEKACLHCHEAHSSDHQNQLRLPKSQLCASCHNRVNIEDKENP